MDKKDRLGLELKSIMEEKSQGVNLSQDTIKGILNSRKKGLIYQIKAFLNKEIEVPLMPALAGFTVFLIFVSVPRGLLTYESKEIIEIGNGQVIISSREVDKK